MSNEDSTYTPAMNPYSDDQNGNENYNFRNSGNIIYGKGLIRNE